MSIATTETSQGGGDYRWLASARGTQHPKSATLDLSDFTEGTHYPDGYIPSGTPVSYRPADGMYGPFSGSTGDADETGTITEGGSGLTSYTLTFGGQTTTSIDDDATAAQVEAALEALSTIGEGNIEVTGGPLASGPFTFRFVGDLAGTDVGSITSTPTGGTGTVTIAVTTAGNQGLDGFVWHDVDASGDPVAAILTDVTIVAEYLPVSVGLTDGRYLCDTVASEA